MMSWTKGGKDVSSNIKLQTGSWRSMREMTTARILSKEESSTIRTRRADVDRKPAIQR
jgi:hypothetical protein